MKSRHLLPVTALAFTLFGCATDITSVSSDFGFRAGKKEEPTGPITKEKSGDIAQPLNLAKRTHVLLEVDGGGIMGITPALILAGLEKELRTHRPDFANKHLHDLFSVCSGTSTGAIITGMIAGGVSGEFIGKYYTTEGVELFDSKAVNPFPIYPIFRPKFKRKVFQDSLYSSLQDSGVDSHITLKELYHGPLLLIATYDLCENRTVWFRTREMNDGPLAYNRDVQLVDAISASALSAPVYFGSLPARGIITDHWESDGRTEYVRGAVFNDGGQGTQNNTLAQTALQAIMRNWGAHDQVVIISLGCGNSNTLDNYQSRSSLSSSGQLLAFLQNEARPESTILQWRAATFIADQNPNVKVFRFDYVPAAGSSAFSAKLHDKYEEAARTIMQRPDFVRLAADLCKVPLAPTGPEASTGGPRREEPKGKPEHVKAL